MPLKWLSRWRNPDNLTSVHLAALSRQYGFEVGSFSYGRPRVRFPGSGAQLSIGRYVSIGDRVEIFLGGNHRTDWVTTYPFSAFPRLWSKADSQALFQPTRGAVRIGSDVWIGSGVTILSGVTLEPGCVIGAGAMVARDVPAYAIAVGNPARVVRLRFDPERIKALLKTAWWDLDRLDAEPLIPLLQSDKVEDFIQAVRKVRVGQVPHAPTPFSL